jgi:hypothetical protein
MLGFMRRHTLISMKQTGKRGAAIDQAKGGANVGATYCTTAAQWVRLYSWTTVLRFLKKCCTKKNEKERKLKLMLKLMLKLCGRHCRA